jgi:hypothetical protein
MTPYLKLKLHLDQHVYKRGAFKGEAPADPSRRSRTHMRVLTGIDGAMIVRMYNTDILRVTPDNTICISTRGWFTNTTKQNLNDALARFVGWGRVGTQRVFGYNHEVVRIIGKTYRFYDGMEFDAEGNLLSPAKRFSRKQINRTKTKEFRDNVEARGFKAMWPVLFATSEARFNPGVRGLVYTDRGIRAVMTSEHYADQWSTIAEIYKGNHGDHKSAYQALMRACTKDMTEIVDTDVTVV